MLLEGKRNVKRRWGKLCRIFLFQRMDDINVVGKKKRGGGGGGGVKGGGGGGKKNCF